MRTSGIFRHGHQLPQLTDAQLRVFERPRSWREIVTTVGDRYGDADWWRDAVMEADEHGRGLLVWDARAERWKLSARGRLRLGLSLEVEPRAREAATA